MDWHEIWERKGSVEIEQYDLEALMALDGWDAAGLTEGQLRELADLVRSRLSLRRGLRLLDVGCGAGALLWCLRDSGADLLGVDFSASLIEHASRAMPGATFDVAEAAQLPFEADAIVSLGVFQYFPDHDYARRVLAEFQRVAPTALILDVPDLATREQSQAKRAAAGSKLGHNLYYPRDFFGGTTWTNSLVGYRYAPFRFHCEVRFDQTSPDESTTEATGTPTG